MSPRSPGSQQGRRGAGGSRASDTTTSQLLSAGQISKALLRRRRLRAFGLHELLFWIQWAEVVSLLWLGRGPFQKCQTFLGKKKTHSFFFSSRSHFQIWKLYFSALVGFPPCAQATGRSLSGRLTGCGWGCMGANSCPHPRTWTPTHRAWGLHTGWVSPSAARKAWRAERPRGSQEMWNLQKGFPADPVFSSKFFLILTGIFFKEK